MKENKSHDLAVVCREVGYIYPDGNRALKGLNMEIPRRVKAGIIGPNGAGKSTFLSLLNGVRAADGTILINGLEVNRKNLPQIKSLVGLVFQNPDDQLFSPTVIEDIAFGPLNMGLSREEVINRVTAALDEVGLSGFQERSTLRLSFGEKKLASIATILSMSPQIIALDEPTSNLDSLHRRKIINWIKSCDHTCIITSHDLDMIYETCDRVYIFNRGRMIGEGDVKTILTHRSLLEANDMELPLGLGKGK